MTAYVDKVTTERIGITPLYSQFNSIQVQFNYQQLLNVTPDALSDATLRQITSKIS